MCTYTESRSCSTCGSAFDRGFTLVEAIVATTLLAVALTALAHVLVAAASANRHARTATEAAILAADKLEELRARAMNDPALVPPMVDTLAADIDGFFDAPASGFVRRWAIAPLDAHPADAIVVRVVVLDRGTIVAARLTTIKSRKAP